MAWLGEKFRDMPFGLTRGMSADELSDRLGPPEVRGRARWSVWMRTLDTDRDALFRTPGLRDFAHAWFHNIEVGFIRDDLVAVFGGREGPTGHIKPVLDDDTASAVPKATPALDARFAAWLA